MTTPEKFDRERFQLALRASNEGIWQWLIDDNVIEYSEKVSAILGYSPQGNPPHFLENLQDLYHPDDAAYLQDQLDAIFAPHGNELFAADCRYNHPDGKQHWLRIRGACVRNDDGIITRLAGSIIDITKRKTAEQALEEERFRLSQLIESIPVNVYFKDKESRFVKTNSATSEKMGLTSPEDIIGKTDHDFFDVRHADKSLHDEVAIMETLEHQDGSLEQELWEGKDESWCITSKYPWLDHNGKVKGTFGVTNDVTDLVNAQKRLVKIAALLKEKNQQYEEELKLANEVQRSILQTEIPPIPSTNSLTKTRFKADFNAIYLPMAGLAGDFYEVIPLSETKVGILMCDVMGHGVRASLIVALLSGLISKEIDQADQANSFLYGINQELHNILAKSGVTMFATALYAIIDVSNGTLEFANAGHPLPIIRQGNKYLQILPENYQKQPALGLMPEIIYQQYKLALDSIDEFILFTDGVNETTDRNDNELEISGVIRLLEQNHSPSPHSISALVESLRDYSKNQSFNDDVCLLSVAIQPSQTRP